jgi:hypothetical protein
LMTVIIISYWNCNALSLYFKSVWFKSQSQCNPWRITFFVILPVS